jgi:protein associated with RNAse G/E
MTIDLWQDIVVQSYKHNTKLHRIWAQATVIDTKEDHLVIANYRTKVIESNGRFWYTKEPSVTWFFKERWFNVIGILRPTGIFYYCNIASPYMIDDEALKYIDYDLDIKVSPDYSYTILDRKEYNKHKVKMEYPASIRTILENELSALKQMIENHEGPFEEGVVKSYYDKYMRYCNQE